MSKRNTRIMLLALAFVLAGRLAIAEAKPGEKNTDAAKTTQVTYPVADLVVPVQDHDGTAKPPPRTVEDKLMALVRAVVEPASWAEQGGRASMQYHPVGMALVVNQTPEAHAAIVHLLKALRRLQEVEVVVELRVVQLPPELAEEFRTKGGFEENQGDDGKRVKRAFFTDKELYPWLRLFQGDPASSVLMAPKLTTFNGQQAVVQCTQQEKFVTEYRVVRAGEQAAVVPHHETVDLGNRCVLRPTVSADRRFVRLELDYRYATRTGSVGVMPVTLKVATAGGQDREFRGVVQQPNVQTLTVKQSCAIPDGRTMAIALGQVSEEGCTETALPVLRDLPFVGRCFRNIGYVREDRDVFLLVTPRIIINEEEEMVFRGDATPRP